MDQALRASGIRSCRKAMERLRAALEKRNEKVVAVIAGFSREP